MPNLFFRSARASCGGSVRRGSPTTTRATTTTTTTTTTLAALVALSGAGCLRPTNAFDPEAPPALQAPGSVRGTVQAVLAPIVEDTGAACTTTTPAACTAENAACCVPAAAFCAPIVGDHSGFRLGLRGLVADDADGAVLAFSNETGPSGEFLFQNITPGSYSLEVVRDGFTVPATRTIDVGAGDDIVLAPLCATDATPPAPPVLLDVPTVRTASSSGTIDFTVTIADCAAVDGDAKDAAASFHVTVVSGAAVLADARVVAADADADGNCHVAVAADAPDDAEVWVVQAHAEDGVGNTSDPTLRSVFVDVDAPAAPALAEPVVALDRVSVSYSQDDGSTDVDHYLVSYGLIARPDTALCPSESHVIDPQRGDAFDVAAFAVEGPSPIVTTNLRQTLSGIAPGTELFVHVAAVDVAGNVSCYSPALAVRPDQVTPRLLSSVGAAVAARTVAGEGDVVAFAGGPLAVRGKDGVVVEVALEGSSVDSDDVMRAGGAFYAAAGAVGVVRVDVDNAGAVVGTDVLGGHDVRTLAAVPGGFVYGTGTGVALVDSAGVDVRVTDPGDLGVATSRLALGGNLIVAARTSGRGANATGIALQVLSRDLLLLKETRVLSGAPRRLALAGDKLWSVAAGFVEIYDVAGCLNIESTCLARVARFGLQNGVDATDLVVVDNHVVVWSLAGGFVYAADFTSVPALEGRAFAPAGQSLDVAHVSGAGFCAVGTVDGAGVRGERCYRLINDGLPSERAAVAGQGSVVGVLAGDADQLFFLDAQSDDLGARTVLALTQGARVVTRPAPSAAVDDDIAEPAGRATLKDAAFFPGFGVIAVDQYGRLLVAHSSDTQPTSLDVADDSAIPGGLIDALATAAPGLTLTLDDDDGDRVAVLDDARVRVIGTDVVVAAVGRGADDLQLGCPQAYVIRYRLAPTADLNGVAIDAVDAVAVGRAFRVTDAVVRNNELYVGVHPFGVAVVDKDALTVGADTALAACDADSGNSATVADAFPLNALALDEGRVYATGVKGPGFPTRDALLDVTTANHQLLTAADAELRAVVGVGPFLAVTTQDPASAVLIRIPRSGDSAFFPVAALTGVDSAFAVVATRSGVVVADGAAGLARFVVR